jgi:ABC-type nickel/cobalt efflux system permease component RcnA
MQNFLTWQQRNGSAYKWSSNLRRLWTHLIAVYLISGFVFWLLWKEYKEISEMRHGYLADAKKAPDQFTVLTRQIPPSSTETISEHVEHFFTVQASERRTRVWAF